MTTMEATTVEVEALLVGMELGGRGRIEAARAGGRLVLIDHADDPDCLASRRGISFCVAGERRAANALQRETGLQQNDPEVDRIPAITI